MWKFWIRKELQTLNISIQNVKITTTNLYSYPTGFVTRLTRRVPLVEHELLTLQEHLSSPPILSGVRVTRSLVLCVCFVDRCLSFCTFSFGHCVVCPSSINGCWLLLWYLQTLLPTAVPVEEILIIHTIVHFSMIISIM